MTETPATKSNRIFDVLGASEMLLIAPDTTRDWIRSGKLPAFKLGTNKNAPIRIKESDIEALMVPVIPKGPRSQAKVEAPTSEPTAPRPPRSGSRYQFPAPKTEAQHRD